MTRLLINDRMPDSSLDFKYSNELKNGITYISSTLEINQRVIDKQDSAQLKKFFENMHRQSTTGYYCEKKKISNGIDCIIARMILAKHYMVAVMII